MVCHLASALRGASHLIELDPSTAAAHIGVLCRPNRRVQMESSISRDGQSKIVPHPGGVPERCALLLDKPYIRLDVGRRCQRLCFGVSPKWRNAIFSGAEHFVPLQRSPTGSSPSLAVAVGWLAVGKRGSFLPAWPKGGLAFAHCLHTLLCTGRGVHSASAIPIYSYKLPSPLSTLMIGRPWGDTRRPSLTPAAIKTCLSPSTTASATRPASEA